MLRWEYKTVRVDVGGVIKTKIDPGVVDATLHRHGREGWELVTMFYVEAEMNRSTLVGIMKRPVRDDQPAVWNESRGTCPRCGYDLRALEHAVCPECGWAVS